MRVSPREWIVGLVIPVAVIVILAGIGRGSDSSVAFIALIALVPLITALVAGPLPTGLTAIVAVLAAAVTAAGSFGTDFYDALPVLIGVIVAAGAAVLLSRWRTTRPVKRGATPARSSVPRAAATTDPDVDPVTGLPTRAAASRTLAATAPTGPRVIALIDCDGLGRLNEQYGEDIGDTFLFAVGGRTSWALADEDTVARWDDDELLFTAQGEPTAVAPTLQLIADKVNQNPIRTDSGLLPMTMSVGAAVWPEGMDVDTAVARARAALASAKAQGPGTLVFDDSAT